MNVVQLTEFTVFMMNVSENTIYKFGNSLQSVSIGFRFVRW